MTPNATCMNKLEPILPFHVQEHRQWIFLRQILPLHLSKRTRFSVCKRSLNSSFTEVPTCDAEFVIIAHTSDKSPCLQFLSAGKNVSGVRLQVVPCLEPKLSLLYCIWTLY